MRLPPDAPPGTRFARAADRDLPFIAAGTLAGRLTTADLMGYHRPEDLQFTLFRILGERVAGAACFCLEPQELTVDYLARNLPFTAPGVAVGSVLLSATEHIARLASCTFVRLEALDEATLLAWYRSQGFEPDGGPHSDPAWGRLHPMVKSVAKAPSAPP